MPPRSKRRTYEIYNHFGIHWIAVDWDRNRRRFSWVVFANDEKSRLAHGSHIFKTKALRRAEEISRVMSSKVKQAKQWSAA